MGLLTRKTSNEMTTRGGKRSAFLYLEFLASSVAGGSIFKMDVTHQQATKSALESGKLLGTNNFANMDMFKWYALNDNVMGGVSNGNVTKNDANNLSFGENYQAKTEVASLHVELKLKLDFWMVTLDFLSWLVGIIENILPW